VDTTSALRDFLLSRRRHLRLEDVGLPAHGHRRVTGLRREEVALLAHVSVDHYIRLERGQASRVSDAVLDAVAHALRLTPGERGYLYHLARPAPAPPPPGGSVRGSVQRLLDAMEGTPAYLVGRCGAVLAWNRLAATVFTDFSRVPAPRRTIGWLVFTHPAARTVYADWDAKARETVAYFRAAWGASPGDTELVRQIGELRAASAHFDRLWNTHYVVDLTHGTARVHRPPDTLLDFSWEALRTGGNPDEVVIAYTSATPATAAAMRALTPG
jgi:hypothetical protein